MTPNVGPQSVDCRLASLRAFPFACKFQKDIDRNFLALFPGSFMAKNAATYGDAVQSRSGEGKP
ncbi:MAG: hypothetical protein UZ03_NOB001002586 [Nitrospira sp. OLB3]|nr:MAG: hypothetical protein UZ03_NOB001002586 [Nitrospira sp. OLB3]